MLTEWQPSKACGVVESHGLRFTPCKQIVWECEVEPGPWPKPIERHLSPADLDIQAGRVRRFTSIDDMFRSLADESVREDWPEQD